MCRRTVIVCPSMCLALLVTPRSDSVLVTCQLYKKYISQAPTNSLCIYLCVLLGYFNCGCLCNPCLYNHFSQSLSCLPCWLVFTLVVPYVISSHGPSKSGPYMEMIPSVFLGTYWVQKKEKLIPSSLSLFTYALSSCHLCKLFLCNHLK